MKRGSIVKGLLGVDALKRAFGATSWIRSSAGRMTGWGRMLFGKSERTWPEVPTEVDNAADRFEWLRLEQGMTETDILALRKRAKNQFALWAWLSVAMISVAIVSPSLGLLGKTFFPILDIAFPWIIAAAVVFKAAVWSYWSLQLRRRELLPFTVWLRSPGEWLAPINDRVGAWAALLPIAAIAMTVALLPQAAVAQALPPVQLTNAPDTNAIFQAILGPIQAGDLSLEWLSRMFPSALGGQTGVSYEQDVMAQLFNTINTLFAALAALMITWHTITGVASTAMEGKVLGGRYNTLWAPVRIVLGVASIVPIKGYCLAQLVALYVIVGGYQLANLVWYSYVGLMVAPISQIAEGRGTLAIAPPTSAQKQAFDAILASEMCYWTAKWHGRPASGGLATDASLNGHRPPGYFGSRPMYAYPPAEGVPVKDGRVWDYGTACGRIFWSIRDGSSQKKMAEQVILEAAAGNWQHRAEIAAEEGEFDTARADAFGRFVTEMRQDGFPEWAAARYAAIGADPGDPPDMLVLLKGVQQSFADYKTEVLSASRSLSERLDTGARAEFLVNAARLGWASAGALHPQIVRANATVAARLDELPTIEGPNQEEIPEERWKILNRAVISVNVLTYAGKAGNPAAAEDFDLAESLDAENPDKYLDQLVKRLSRSVNELLINAFSVNVLDPMGSIQAFGHGLMLAVQTIYFLPPIALAAISGGMEAGGTAAANIPIIGWFAGTGSSAIGGAIKTALLFVQGFWSSTAVFLMALGAANAYVLPMLQYTMWLFGIVGLIVFSVESVVAASFWAFSHVRMDGAELVDQQQKYGYAILFNALFRPTLMLIGLALGSVAFSVTAQFVNTTFALASEMSQGSHYVGVIGLIVMLGMLLYIHYHLAIRSYSLITQLPDRVARWSGMQAENLGEEGDQHTTSNIAGAIVYRGSAQTAAGMEGRLQAARAKAASAGKDAAAATGRDAADTISKVESGEKGKGGATKVMPKNIDTGRNQEQ